MENNNLLSKYRLGVRRNRSIAHAELDFIPVNELSL